MLHSILSPINIAVNIVVVLIILIIYSRYLENSLLSGFWRADPEFCAESQLSAFILYLTPCNMFSHSMTGYFLASSDANVIINESATINFGARLSLKPYVCDQTYNITVDWSDEHDPETCPAELQIRFSPNGTLVLENDGIAYARMYKDLSLWVARDRPDFFVSFMNKKIKLIRWRVRS